MVSLNKEYNQIINLTKFNVNFSEFIDKSELLSQSPDYILEKYNHWIGFNPTIECKLYTPDDMTTFFLKYWKRWGIFEEYSVKNILMYLYSTQNLSVLTLSQKFEEYIGPINLISDIPDKRGLHTRTEGFVSNVLEKNEENIKVVLRDMKLRTLV